MRPYIICHMLSSVDGKIDAAALDSVIGDGVSPLRSAALPLKLTSVERLGSDTLWLRYKVVKA